MKKAHPYLFEVTAVSRYLALLIFILLPFLGGFVGYKNAPEKIVEVWNIEISKVADPENKVRFIPPDGYVINNELFFSPSMGLLFRGRLDNIEFTGSSFASCGEEDCFEHISILPYDLSETPVEFISKLILAEGGNPSQCEIEELKVTNPYSDNYAVSPRDEVIVTDQNLLEYHQSKYPDEPFITLEDYRTFCKDNNLECYWNERVVMGKKSIELCSKYSNGNFYGSSLFLFPISGRTEALFVHYDGGNGDAGTLDSVQYTSRDHLDSKPY